jgi:hypothetical protein
MLDVTIVETEYNPYEQESGDFRRWEEVWAQVRNHKYEE